MNEWIDREYWEEEFDLDDEVFYLDDEYEEFDDEEDWEDSGGSLVPNRPHPKKPSHGAEVELEEELALV